MKAAPRAKQIGKRWRNMRPRLTMTCLAILLSACGPRAERGGPGTDKPYIDNPALGLGLDRMDIEYLVQQNLNALSASQFWDQTIEKSPQPPLMAIWPVENTTTQHVEDQLDSVLLSIETYLVNTNDVRMVNRSRQQELMRELQVQRGAGYDPQTAGEIGRQLGVKYFVTGRLTAVDERLRNTRRVQYSLIMRVIELETGLIVFQNEATRTKQLTK